MRGQQGPDQRPDHRALPRPGGPRDQHMRRDQPQPPRRAVLAPAHRQPGQVHLPSDRQGRDRIGEGVGADQLQQQRAGRDVADPAQPGAERVGQVLGLGREVGRGLPGDQADPYQVDGPGPVHLAEDREHRLAAVVRGEPGQGHRGLPAAPVEPPPPPVPHRHRDEPGEPRRLHDPQPDQARDSRPPPGPRCRASPARARWRIPAAAAASMSGWVSANHSTRQISRSSWTTRMTASGVRYTGDRHTGGANGSRLSIWASCSPRTQLRPRGTRLASSHHAPAGGDTRGGRNARSCRPTRRCQTIRPPHHAPAPDSEASPSGPGCRACSRSTSAANLAAWPASSRANSSAGPVTCRSATEMRHRHRPARDVQDRGVIVVRAQERPPVLRRRTRRRARTTRRRFSCRPSLTSGPGPAAAGARMPVALSE